MTLRRSVTFVVNVSIRWQACQRTGRGWGEYYCNFFLSVRSAFVHSECIPTPPSGWSKSKKHFCHPKPPEHKLVWSRLTSPPATPPPPPSINDSFFQSAPDLNSSSHHSLSSSPSSTQPGRCIHRREEKGVNIWQGEYECECECICVNTASQSHIRIISLADYSLCRHKHIYTQQNEQTSSDLTTGTTNFMNCTPVWEKVKWPW